MNLYAKILFASGVFAYFQEQSVPRSCVYLWCNSGKMFRATAGLSVAVVETRCQSGKTWQVVNGAQKICLACVGGTCKNCFQFAMVPQIVFICFDEYMS